MPFRKLLNSLAQELQSGFQGAGGGSGGNGYGYGGYGGFRGYGGLGGGGGGGNPFSNSPFTAALPSSILQANVSCPRQQPQAGFQDWIGLSDPRYAYFNVCPSCYNSVVRPTPYAQFFVTKGPPANPTIPIRCDMSRFWVKVAGMVLLTMNSDGRLGVDFLAKVAALSSSPPGQGGQPMCPNAELRSEAEPLAMVDTAQDPQRRTWYTLFDPHTRAQLLPGWNICGSCAVNVMTCCPAVSGGLTPIQPHPGQGITCALVPSERYDDPRTMSILQQIAACAVTSGFMRRPDMSALVNWLRASLPPPRGPGAGMTSQGMPGELGGAAPSPNGLCPRDHPSTMRRCRTMQGLFDFTVCEQCYKEVVENEFNRGIGLAGRLGRAPAATVGGTGFTCQLYSERMRRVWKEAVSMEEQMGFEHLRAKVAERKAKERELQIKTAQLKQQAASLRIEAQTKEHLAANAMRVSMNAASTNIMLAGVGAGRRIDDFHIEVPSGQVDLSQTTQLNNQAAMLKMQAAQAGDQARMAQEEWRRYWE